MSTQFLIQSSDPAQLEKATRVAKEFVRQFENDEIVGIVFLGTIARGYFDASADIDIALFKKQASVISLPASYSRVQGFEIHCHLEDYDSEVQAPWDMAKRWTYSAKPGLLRSKRLDISTFTGKSSIAAGGKKVVINVRAGPL